MPKINWTWFLVGIGFALFLLPFIQAKLGATLSARKPVSTNGNV